MNLFVVVIGIVISVIFSPCAFSKSYFLFQLLRASKVEEQEKLQLINGVQPRDQILSYCELTEM